MPSLMGECAEAFEGRDIKPLEASWPLILIKLLLPIWIPLAFWMKRDPETSTRQTKLTVSPTCQSKLAELWTPQASRARRNTLLKRHVCLYLDLVVSSSLRVLGDARAWYQEQTYPTLGRTAGGHSGSVDVAGYIVIEKGCWQTVESGMEKVWRSSWNYRDQQ